MPREKAFRKRGSERIRNFFPATSRVDLPRAPCGNPDVPENSSIKTSVLEDVVSHLIRRRWAWLTALVLATAALAVPAARVGVDNAVDVWFVKGDPALESYHRFQETFGNDEVVVVGVVADRGVFEAATLDRLRVLTTRLEAVTGVARVLSVSNVRMLEGGLGTLEVRPAMPASGPITDADAAALKVRIDGDPLLRERVVKGDGKVALVFAQMAAMADIDQKRHGVLADIEKVLDDVVRPHHTVHVAGIGVIYDALNQISQKEAGLFMGLSFLVIFGLLGPFFRGVKPVLIAAGAVASALIMTRGLFGLFGHDDNMVTLTLPVLIIVLGVAEAVHILRHRAAHPNDPPEKVLAEILVPCAFTSITTVVGFGSLVTSKVAVVADFGLFAAIGIALAFITTTIVTAFAFGSKNLRLRPPAAPETGRLEGVLLWCSRFATRNKERVIAGSSLVVLLAGWGMMQVETDTFSIGFLPDDHLVRTDSDALERLIGPFTPLEFVISTTDRTAEAGKDPAVLRGLEAFQRALEADATLGIGDTLSAADVTARLHQLSGGEGTSFEVPNNAAMIAQDLEVYGSDPDNQAKDLADVSWNRLRVTVAVPVLSAKGYAKLIERIETIAKTTLPGTVSLEPSGYLPLYVKMIDYVVESQVSSFGWAFLLVFLLMALLFRSWKLTALAIPPNVYPSFVLLGVMGVLGIHLDIATATITSIVTGIIVDDTIHYLHSYRVELARLGDDHAKAADAAALSTGRSVMMSSVLFFAGFSILLFASVKSIVYFGLLTALAMVVGVISDLFLLPAMLVALKPKLSPRS